MTTESYIADLESEMILLQGRITQAKQEIADAKEARKLRTPVQVVYSLLPMVDRYRDLFDTDHGCLFYYLDAKVTNKEEALAAGYKEDQLPKGGIGYLFNTLSDRFVMRQGGGYIHLGFCDRNENEKQILRETMDQLEDFITAYPEGGDITSIVLEHKRKVGR